MTRRRWLIAILAVLAFTLANWWLFHKPSTQGPGLATVRFGISAFQDTLLPVVSEQKGWYHEEGLNVELKVLGWTEVQEALAAGQVDVALNNISAVIGIHSRAPDIVYLYGLNPFDNGSALMIRPDGKLKTVQQIEAQVHDHAEAVRMAAAQLKGKSVVTTGQTDMEQAVAAAARRGGLDFRKDLKIVDLNPDEGLAAFLGGEGDAYLGGIPQRTRAGKEGMLEMLTGADLGPPPINGLVTTRSYYQAHQKELLKILKVWFKTVRYIDSNEDEGGGIIVKRLNENTGAKFTLDDFKKFWNNYEHYPPTPRDAESLILDPNGRNYWKAAWDDCNNYFFDIAHKIPQPVNPSGTFLMQEVQAAYIREFGNQ